MSSSSNYKYNQGLGDDDDRRPCKIRRTSLSDITNLPEDCLSLIFKCLTTINPLKTISDRNSFGLTCHQFLHIQNKNCRSIEYTSLTNYAKTKSLPVVLGNLLKRFQELKYLSLTARPKITVYAASKSQFCGSEVQTLDLDFCSKYSNIKLSLMFSWFPRLVDVSLKGCHITDEGLEALAKCCSSLEVVNLSWCDLITDSGISFLLRNCRELYSLSIGFCIQITGIGFLGCPQTLTWLEANGSKITPEGIKAIVSGGGLEYLELSARSELSWVGEESMTMTMNTEAVLMISKGCPSLRELKVSGFVEVIKPQGWEAIRRNCKSLKVLQLYGRCSLDDRERKALMDGCKKFSRLIANDENSCGSLDDHEPF
ncbi:hypothetical protein MKW92_040476 [Papaver armeniacum]|nr:hypothetical protein MKW92_040476 [Papaver armeniacum]